MGSAYITGNLNYRVNATSYPNYYTSSGNNIGTDWVTAYTHTRVFVAGSGQGVDAYGTDLRRWDGPTPYDLHSFSKSYAATADGLFGSAIQETFRQTQTFGNPEDCVINFRFTITPIND